MSSYKRGVKLAKGALVNELDSSSEDDDMDEEKSDAGEGSEGEMVDDDDDDDDEEEEVDLGWKFEPQEPDNLPSKRKKGAREEKEDDDSGSGESEEEAEESGASDSGEVVYPVTCQICEKVMFNEQSAEQHMKSKLHLKNEQRFYKQEKTSKRTAEQIEKLKARNRAKKEKRMQRKGVEKPQHVWGEHKLPSKKPGDKVKSAGSDAKKRKADADADEVGKEAAGAFAKKRRADADEVGKEAAGSTGKKSKHKLSAKPGGVPSKETAKDNVPAKSGGAPFKDEKKGHALAKGRSGSEAGGVGKKKSKAQ